MATRNRQIGPDIEERIAALETELADLRRRVGRMEGGEVRVLRATPFDGRARPRPHPGGPRCPGCRLVMEEAYERCPYCSLPFHVLPAELRPVVAPKPRAARKATRISRKR